MSATLRAFHAPLGPGLNAGLREPPVAHQFEERRLHEQLEPDHARNRVARQPERASPTGADSEPGIAAAGLSPLPRPLSEWALGNEQEREANGSVCFEDLAVKLVEPQA